MDGRMDRLPALAAELVERRVAVLAVNPLSAAIAAKAATKSIPIVFEVGSDPVDVGLVESLNRPGGNLTGTTQLGLALAPKRLQLLHELVPRATNIGMLVNSDSIMASFTSAEIMPAAMKLGLQMRLLDIRSDGDLLRVFETLAEQKIEALLVSPHPFFTTRRNLLVALLERYSMPAMFPYLGDTVAGGLISYGTDFSELSRNVGLYAGRILKGEKPSDLPILLPTKFQLSINLKTAKALKIEVPPTLLGVANRVIE